MVVIQVTVHEAKSRLAELIAAAESGEEVVLLKYRRPVAKLELIVPRKPRTRRKFGMLEGKIEIPEGSLDSLPDGRPDASEGKS